MTTASPISLPDVHSDEPVTVIPTASVAPLEGNPDGERINIYTVRPKNSGRSPNGLGAGMRERVLAQPLTCAIIAFSLGFIVARVLR